MKRIEAIIRPSRLSAVLEALDHLGISGVTVCETIGFGRQRGHSEVYKGSEESFGLVHKRMLILYVSDQDADNVVRTICEHARTGLVGDGKLAITEVVRTIRIRTGEEADGVVARDQDG
jgi:nitrogen regulatory protein P-II 1